MAVRQRSEFFLRHLMCKSWISVLNLVWSGPLVILVQQIRGMRESILHGEKPHQKKGTTGIDHSVIIKVWQNSKRWGLSTTETSWLHLMTLPQPIGGAIGECQPKRILTNCFLHAKRVWKPSMAFQVWSLREREVIAFLSPEAAAVFTILFNAMMSMIHEVATGHLTYVMIQKMQWWKNIQSIVEVGNGSVIMDWIFDLFQIRCLPLFPFQLLPQLRSQSPSPLILVYLLV